MLERARERVYSSTMNSVQLLKEQMKSAHDALEATMADVSTDTAHFREMGKALPIAAAYAHAIIAEDMVLSNIITQKETIFKDASEAGVSEPMPDFAHWDDHAMWTQNVKVDLSKMKEFGKKVFAVTDEYLSTLTDEDLDKEIERPVIGKHNLAFFITNFLLLHAANLTGEISAAKGMQGLKGYPF